MAVDEVGLRATVAVLRGGGVAIFPTDTVYGVGACPEAEEALRRIFEAKGRPVDKPLQLLCASRAAARRRAAAWPRTVEALARRYWPGALTIVLPAGADVPAQAQREGTVALRVPGDAVTRRLARACGGCIAATSANRSGGPDPRTADEARAQIGDQVDVVLDGGPAAVGTPSTVIQWSAVAGLAVVREGAVPAREVLALAGALEGR